MASSAAAAPRAIEEISQQDTALEVGLTTITREQIAQRAYSIWEREGKGDGKDQDHWFQAIAELTSKTGDDGDDEKENHISSSGTPLTVRTPMVTSTGRRSHYSV